MLSSVLGTAWPAVWALTRRSLTVGPGGEIGEGGVAVLCVLGTSEHIPMLAASAAGW
jgi:hypothetical protein